MEFLLQNIDIAQHFLVGGIIAAALRERGLWVMFILAFGKELHDLTSIIKSELYLEPVKDIAMTWAGYAIILVLVRKILKRSGDRTKETNDLSGPTRTR